MKPESYEAYYARAKAKLDMKLFESALIDVRESLKLTPIQCVEVRKVLSYLREEITNKMTSSSSSTSKMTNHRDLAISVDALHE